MRLSNLVLAVGVLAGCAGNADRFDRSLVSAELEERTGRGLGPGTGMPPDVTFDDGLTESESVAVALWNNPGFQLALAELGIQRAELVQAGLLPNPVLSVLFPLGPKQLEFAAKLPLEFLWLRPGRLAAAEYDCEKVAALLVQAGLDVIRDVRAAFADVRLAARRAELSDEVAALLDRGSELAQARLRAGDVSELEAAAPGVEALGARADAARARRDVAAAREQLRALLGLGEGPRPEFVLRPPGEERPVVDEAVLVSRALAARPDLRAAEMGVQASAERAGLSNWDFLALSGILDANDRKGKDGVEVGPGAELPIPLFDRGQGRRARADAELEKASRHYVAVRERIAAEVRLARVRYLAAREALEISRAQIVATLEEAHRRAERAHEAGETSALPVLEAARRLADARRREAESEAELHRAKAELERSVGRNLP